jgi:hypothetical protein
MKTIILAVSFLLFLALPILAQGQNTCLITDREEYAVLSAVLFPAEPDVPDNITSDLAKKAYLSLATIHLDGFHGSTYNLSDETMTTKTAGKSNDSMESSFNKNNIMPCRIGEIELKALVPEGKHVHFMNSQINAAQLGTAKEGEGAKRTSIFTGIARLSRPGFNSDRTEAMVDAVFQADPEMGVGYRVFLKISPKTGKWFITGAARTRIY